MDGRERTGVHPEELRAGRKALMWCGGPSAPRSPPSCSMNCMQHKSRAHGPVEPGPRQASCVHS